MTPEYAIVSILVACLTGVTGWVIGYRSRVGDTLAKLVTQVAVLSATLAGVCTDVKDLKTARNVCPYHEELEKKVVDNRQDIAVLKSQAQGDR